MSTSAALEIAAKTDVGRIRSQNEDAIAIDSASGLAVLADGMGGYNAGEVASRIAVQTAMEALRHGLAALPQRDPLQEKEIQRSIRQLIVNAVRQANTAVFEHAHADPACSGMGTTLVAAVFRPGFASIGHVGDSRAYRLRDKRLMQLTRDHSVLQELSDTGIRGSSSHYRNLLTRAVGIGSEIDVEVNEFDSRAGDLYMLCSDGLSGLVSDHEIADLLMRARTTLEERCEALVQAANYHGGYDNISIILVSPLPLASSLDGITARLFSWNLWTGQ